MCREEIDSEKIWLRGLMAHDKTAFRRLFDLYRNEVYAYSKSILKQEEYAEEIVQDVFLKIWLNRENLDLRLSFRSYIFTITRNLTINFLHKAANDKRLREEIFYGSQQFYSPSDYIFDEVHIERIRQQAIDLLPPKRRRIFELSRNEGMSYEEISQKLGISLSTVKNQMHNALQTIRDFLFAHSDLTFTALLLISGWL